MTPLPVVPPVIQYSTELSMELHKIPTSSVLASFSTLVWYIFGQLDPATTMTNRYTNHLLTILWRIVQL